MSISAAGEILPSRPWLALSATLAVQMLATMTLSAAPILAPAVAPEIGVAPERVGIFMATAYLFAMISGLAGGPWVGRIGAIRLSQILLVTAALGMAAATTGVAWLLLGAAALVGIGYGAANPSAAAILGRHAPVGSPGLFFSLKQAGVPLGIGLSGLLMPLGLLALGWRGTAWATAAVCLLLAALLTPAVKLLDPQERALAPAGHAWAHALRAVVRHPGLRRLSLVSLVYAMAQQGFLTFSVLLLTQEVGLPLALAAALLAASQVACTLVRIGTGHVGDRWISPRVLLGALGLLMAACLLALGSLPRSASMPLAALVMIACGATAMGWNGVYFAEMVRTVPREDLAASSGGVQFFTFGGGMLGPFLFGQLLHLGGSYTAGYAGLAALAAAAGLVMLRPGAASRPGPAA